MIALLPPATTAPTLPRFTPIYQVQLKRAGCVRETEKITSPYDITRLIRLYLEGADRENFVVVMLDTKNHVIGITTVSVGSLDTAIVHPREVFKPAILANAATVVLAHNHPSGDPTPSPDDVAVTRKLQEAGDMIGIEVLDHVIIGDTRHTSLKERGLM